MVYEANFLPESALLYLVLSVIISTTWHRISTRALELEYVKMFQVFLYLLGLVVIVSFGHSLVQCPVAFSGFLP